MKKTWSIFLVTLALVISVKAPTFALAMNDSNGELHEISSAMKQVKSSSDISADQKKAIVTLCRKNGWDVSKTKFRFQSEDNWQVIDNNDQLKNYQSCSKKIGLKGAEPNNIAYGTLEVSGDKKASYSKYIITFYIGFEKSNNTKINGAFVCARPGELNFPSDIVFNTEAMQALNTKPKDLLIFLYKYDSLEDFSWASESLTNQAIKLFAKYKWPMPKTEMAYFVCDVPNTQSNLAKSEWKEAVKISKALGLKGDMKQGKSAVYGLEQFCRLGDTDKGYMLTYTVFTNQKDKLQGACLIIRSNERKPKTWVMSPSASKNKIDKMVKMHFDKK